MATYTTVQAGDWTDPFTWGYGSPAADQPANPSFESPAIGSGNLDAAPSGFSWTYSGGGFQLANGATAFGVPAQPDGSQSVILRSVDNGGPGTVTQTFTLAAGTYNLSFQACRRSSATPTLRVRWDGSTVYTAVLSSTAWGQFVVTGLTSAGTVTLEFSNQTASGDNDLFIDDVQVLDPPTGVPGDGDVANVNHAVTVDADTTVGTSPGDRTTYDLNVGSTAGVALTVAAGVTLRTKGNVKLDRTSGSESQIVLSAGAKWHIDGGYSVMVGNDFNGASRIVCNGSSGSRCEVRRTAATTGYVQFTYNAFYEGGAWTASYTDIIDIGDASNNAALLANSQNSSWSNCLFLRCGTFNWNNGLVWNASVTLTDCTFRESVATTNVSCAINNNNSNTGTRSVTGCSFDKFVGLPLAGPFAVTGNVFLASVGPAGSYYGGTGGVFEDNVIRAAIGDNTGSLPGGGQGGISLVSDWVNNLLIQDGNTLDQSDGTYSATLTSTNPHWLNHVLPVVTAIEDCVFEDFGSSDDGDVDYGPNDTGVGSAWLRVIGISQAGSNPGTLSTFNGATGATGSYDHCTWQTSQVGPLTLGESANGLAGMVTSYRSNIFWRASYDATVFKVGSYNTGSLTTDIGDAADLDYNCGHNVNTTTGVGGNGYNLPLTGTPGVNDVDVDPQFVDPTRNFSTWVASIEATWSGNGSPSRTDYNARGLWKLSLKNLTADPDYDAAYTLAAYLTYLRAGFAPTNVALKDAGHDGVTIGAVEGVWPGGGNRRRRILIGGAA